MPAESLANYALVPIVIAFGIVALRARRQRRLLLGLGVRHGAIRELAVGFGLGTGAILALFAIESATGLVHITGAGLRFGVVAGYLIYLAILATIEEIAFRGLLLTGLAAATKNTWVALGISSLLVAISYLFGTGATALTFLSALLAGVMYGLAFLTTGRVWTSIGLRCAWNFIQGPILGFTVSGTVIGSRSVLTLSGSTPTWLVGGSYGPEGGLIGIAIRLVVIIVIATMITGRHAPWAISRQRQASTPEPTNSAGQQP